MKNSLMDFRNSSPHTFFLGSDATLFLLEIFLFFDTNTIMIEKLLNFSSCFFELGNLMLD